MPVATGVTLWWSAYQPCSAVAYNRAPNAAGICASGVQCFLDADSVDIAQVALRAWATVVIFRPGEVSIPVWVEPFDVRRTDFVETFYELRANGS
jgi:hypothetical protein